MISIALVMAFVGVEIALIIGILIFSSVENSIDCPIEGQEGFEDCNKAKFITWVVISVLPITMFFALFAIFGGISGGDYDTPRNIVHNVNKNTNNKLKQILLVIGLAKRK